MNKKGRFKTLFVVKQALATLHGSRTFRQSCWFAKVLQLYKPIDSIPVQSFCQSLGQPCLAGCNHKPKNELCSVQQYEILGKKTVHIYNIDSIFNLTGLQQERTPGKENLLSASKKRMGYVNLKAFKKWLRLCKTISVLYSRALRKPNQREKNVLRRTYKLED